MTLHAVARWADACNVVGDPAAVKRKFEVLRGHCEEIGHDFGTIERTNLSGFVMATKERMELPEASRGNVLTVSQVIDQVGEYQVAGAQLLILSSEQNDRETLELFAAEVMPHFV